MNKIFISTLIVALSAFSNVALSVPLIQPTPKPVPTPTPGTGTTPGTTSGALSAVNDGVTVVPGATSTIAGNVTDNDKGFSTVRLIDSPVSPYGFLVFDSKGAFTYKLYEGSPDILALKTGQVVWDQFRYSISSGIKSATATLTVTIIGNQLDASGNTIYSSEAVNVEVEKNNSSATANTLTPGKMIKGALYASNDKDWYSIGSDGDEVVHIEVCAKGSVCFGKKSWVMYVFDGSKLTPEMQNTLIPLVTRQDDTGAIVDGGTTYSDSLYLAYEAGVYEDALIDVIDPCFDNTNSIDVGAASGARTYYVAISVPLKRDGTGCGDGSVVLKRPGSQTGTTEEYISAYPNSDDEYALKVSHTSTSPGVGRALPYANAATIPSFNEKQHLLSIPKLRIFNDLYTATLNYKGSLINMSKDPSQVVTMTVKKITGLLEPLSGDPYQGTFNPENDQVVLSKVFDSKTGDNYSATLKYHPALGKKPLWLEVISLSRIQ